MKLTAVQIKNFRSIKNYRLTFSNSFQVLVGINESGKTNILRALRLLDPTVVAGPLDRRVPLESEPQAERGEVIFVFDLSVEEKVRLGDLVRGQFICQAADQAVAELRGTARTLEQLIAEYSQGLCFINLEDFKRNHGTWKKAIRVVKGWAKATELIPVEIESAWGSYSQIDKGDLVYVADYDIDPSKLEPATPDDVTRVFSEEIGNIVKAELPKCVFWTYRDEYLLPSSLSLDAFVSDPATCVPLQYMFELAETWDIAKAINDARQIGPHRVRSLLDRVATRATKHIRSVWKEFKSVEIRLELNGGQIDASAIDHFNRFAFADRSDGFKRFVSFLLIISARVRADTLTDTLLLVDEPEIGLHPSGVKYLRDELLKVAEKNLVVASTHSIFMIDRNRIDRHLIVSKKEETTEVQAVDSTNIVEEEVVYNALGYSIFEGLAQFNLIFEGWRDKKLFEVACTDTSRIPKDDATKLLSYGRCHLQGVKDVGRVVPILELANREYLLLSDSDQPATEARKRFSGQGQWMQYADLGAPNRIVTSEDFISAKAFERRLAEIAGTFGVAPLVLNDDVSRQPRIAQIRGWIGGLPNISGDQAKTLIAEMKDHVSAAIKKNVILDEYFEVLARLLAVCPTVK